MTIEACIHYADIRTAIGAMAGSIRKAALADQSRRHDDMQKLRADVRRKIDNIYAPRTDID